MSRHRRPVPAHRRVALPLLIALAGIACLTAAIVIPRTTGSVDRGKIPNATARLQAGIPGWAQWAPAAEIAPDLPSVDPATAGGTPAATATASKQGPMRLVRLQVPSMHIAAPVIDIGVVDGFLSIPTDPRVLGRWTGGAQPGQTYGSVVVAGHVDNRVEEGALFDLHNVKLHTTIVAVGADGRTIDYEVVAVKEVAKAALVPQLDPFRQDVEPRLVVVTCGGTFDRAHRTYADNIVVFAVPKT